MKKKLGNFETAATISDENGPWNLVGVLRLDGSPPPEMVRKVLDILQRRHPPLRVRLVKESAHYFFETGGVPEIPIKVIDRVNDDQWMQTVEHELNHHVDSTRGPLAQCMYLLNENGQGELILAFHHSIADGSSVLNLFHELLSLCAEIDSGSEIRGYEESLPPLPPVRDSFPPAFKGFSLKLKTLIYSLRQMGDELSYQFHSWGKRKPPINEAARNRIISLRIPEEATTSLIRQTRKERISLNSLLHTAALLAVEKHLYNGEETPLRYMLMANLRPYLKPPIIQNELGCYFAPLRFTTRITGYELWPLARKINEQMYQAFKRGDKFIASLMGEQLIRMTFRFKAFRMCTTAISYTGVANLKSSYGPFQVVGLHGFVSNFNLGPEYMAQVMLFNDELSWDILYLDTDMNRHEAQQIAEEIQKILGEAANV